MSSGEYEIDPAAEALMLADTWRPPPADDEAPITERDPQLWRWVDELERVE